MKDYDWIINALEKEFGDVFSCVEKEEIINKEKCVSISIYYKPANINIYIGFIFVPNNIITYFSVVGTKSNNLIFKYSNPGQCPSTHNFTYYI